MLSGTVLAMNKEFFFFWHLRRLSQVLKW